MQGLSLFADIPSFTGCSIPWIKMIPLCHTAVRHVCTRHSSLTAAPLVSHQQVRWTSQWAPGWRFLPTSLAVEQLPQVRPPSILSQGAAEPSDARGFRACRLAAFQGSWERLVGRCVAMHLHSDYRPYGTVTGWSNSISKLKGTNSLPLSTSFWRGKRGKVSHT